MAMQFCVDLALNPYDHRILSANSGRPLGHFGQFDAPLKDLDIKRPLAVLLTA